MEKSVSLKKQGIVVRMVHHPVGAAMGGILSAAVCGILGSAHGSAAAGVMAALGGVVGALFGAMMAASSHQEL